MTSNQRPTFWFSTAALLVGLLAFSSFFIHMDRWRINVLNGIRSTPYDLVECINKKNCSPKTWTDGIYYYQNLKPRFSSSAELENALGYCFFQLKEYALAIKHFKEALRLDHNQNYGYVYNLSVALMMRGNKTEALKYLTEGQALLKSESLFKSTLVFPSAGRFESLVGQPNNAQIISQWIWISNQNSTLLKNSQNPSGDDVLFYYIPLFKVIVNGQEQSIL